MKKIRLKNYTSPDRRSVRTIDKLYHVSLGNGYSANFPNEKETQAFLSQTNRELNNKMYELNFLFSEVMKTYRNAWPYFELGQKNIKNNLQEIIKNKITDVESSFNFMVDRAGWENGNHTVFNHFYSIIGTIKEICVEFSQLFLTKNHSVAMYEADSLIVRLEHIYTSIVIYPQKIELVTENRQIKAILKVI